MSLWSFCNWYLAFSQLNQVMSVNISGFNLTRAFARSCMSFRSNATFTGSIFFSCNRASKSPIVIHASLFPSILAPCVVTPLPTTYGWWLLPGIEEGLTKTSAMAAPEKIKNMSTFKLFCYLVIINVSLIYSECQHMISSRKKRWTARQTDGQWFLCSIKT